MAVAVAAAVVAVVGAAVAPEVGVAGPGLEGAADYC